MAQGSGSRRSIRFSHRQDVKGTNCDVREWNQDEVSPPPPFLVSFMRPSRPHFPGGRANTTRLWQKMLKPTEAAKLLNPRYGQRSSRNARFKTEMLPSIPARNRCQAEPMTPAQSESLRGIARRAA